MSGFSGIDVQLLLIVLRMGCASDTSGSRIRNFVASDSRPHKNSKNINYLPMRIACGS